MNPKAYCIEHGMQTAVFVRKAREVAPKYSKVAHSMASNPEYGLVLSPSVTAHIRGRPEKRSKPCKFTFRLAEADNGEFNRARAVFVHSKQQAAEYAARLYIEKAASLLAQESGSDGGAVKNIG